MVDLSNWIQATHLRPDTLNRYSTTLAGTPVVIEDFLVEKKALRIAEHLRSEATYERCYGVYRQHSPVTREEWMATGESRRMYTYLKLDGVASEYVASPDRLSYLLLVHALQSGSFNHFFETIAQQRLLPPESVEVHAHTEGDYLRIHNDANKRRRLCAVLYLTPDWSADDGGELCFSLPLRKEFRLEAFFNRLLVFLPTPETRHFIAPLGKTATGKTRYSLVCWFNM